MWCGLGYLLQQQAELGRLSRVARAGILPVEPTGLGSLSTSDLTRKDGDLMVVKWGLSIRNGDLVGFNGYVMGSKLLEGGQG
jgi:hypothetical protein